MQPVAELLAHAQVRTSARYAHLAADPVKAAAPWTRFKQWPETPASAATTIDHLAEGRYPRPQLS